MRAFFNCWFLACTLTGCDQIKELIPGQAPEVVADTGTAATTEAVAGAVEVTAPPASAQVNDDRPTRDGDTLSKLTELSHDLAKALELYVGWKDPVDPFADELSNHEVAPFHVEVVDLQLIQPWMDAVRVHQSFSYTQTDVRRNDGQWGAAITLEVRNDTERVLDAPDFEFGLQLQHGYQTSVCAIDTELDDDDAGKTASQQQRTDRAWSAETTGYERFWRPGEVVRRQLVTMCGDVSMFDAGIGSGTVQVNIEADEYLGNLEHEMVGAVQQQFGADAFILRQVTLGKKRVGFAYGSGVLTFKKGKLRRDLLSDYGLRPDSPDVFTGLPGVLSPVVASMNELDVTINSVEVMHWPDATKKKMNKGARRVAVNLTQTIDSAAIQDRLSSAIEEAKAARKEARQSRNAAEAALEQVRAGGDRQALVEANRAFSNSERNFESAKRMVQVAKNSYENGLTKARDRLGTALSCDRVRLVTPTRDISVNNDDRVRVDCAVLKKKDSTTTTLRYTIGRYEVPVGLHFDLGDKAYIGWVANQVTTTFDAR